MSRRSNNNLVIKDGEDSAMEDFYSKGSVESFEKHAVHEIENCIGKHHSTMNQTKNVFDLKQFANQANSN